MKCSRANRGRTPRMTGIVMAVLIVGTLAACLANASSTGIGAPSSEVAAGTSAASPSPVPPNVTPPPLPSAPESFVFPGRASRVVVPAMGIDLPVVSGDLAPPPDNFPLCNVAQYSTGYRQPGEPGSVYLYAHARTGMFLPLLDASMRADGAEMIGMEVLVYTSDAELYRYRVFEVERHVLDYRLADATPPGEQRLILQTSEGPRGTPGKLVVAADFLDVTPTTPEEANPLAAPVVCE